MTIQPLRTNSALPFPERVKVSNILEVDPGNHETRTVYGGEPSQGFLTTIRGKQDSTPSGGLLVTEFEGGRVFEVDRNGELVWEFINRYDDQHAAEVTEAWLYSPDYFDDTDWTCDS